MTKWVLDIKNKNANNQHTEDLELSLPNKVIISNALKYKVPTHSQKAMGVFATNFIYLFIFIGLFLFCAFLLLMFSSQRVFMLNQVKQFEEMSENFFSQKSKFHSCSGPPPHSNLSAVARYVMHLSDWGSLSTFSTHDGIEEFPFVNVFSVSDGPVENSTGVPFFYLTPMELSVKDIQVNPKASFTVSEAQSNYCATNGFDPEDPRCAHIIFTGTIKKVSNGSSEEAFARRALFSRHPEMEDWPVGHEWFFAKMEIVHIYVLDYFGGAGEVAPEDYFASNPFHCA